MDAVKYFEEKRRMLDKLGRIVDGCVGVDCDECPLSATNNGKKLGCDDLEIVYPEDAVAIVEKWSAENPKKTILKDFLEKYPNAVMYDGRPSGMCPFSLGFENNKEKPCWNAPYRCSDCWDRPLEG